MNNKSERYSLTDLHTHILPGIDDGAQSLETALAMLRMQKKNGIERVALTPHFYPMLEELELFLDRRQRAYAELMSCWNQETMPQMRLGAEVRYTPALLQMDLRRLTIGEGNYLLVELPAVGVATCLDQVTNGFLGQGITPIFAHVERCLAFRNEPNRLFELIRMGALAQIDVCALTSGKKDKFTEECLNNGLAHLIASDIHNLSNRSYFLSDIATEQNMKILNSSEEFARAVWDGTPLPAFDFYPIKKSLFGYRKRPN